MCDLLSRKKSIIFDQLDVDIGDFNRILIMLCSV